MIARQLPKFAEADQPNAQTRVLGAEGAQRLGAKLQKCVVSQRQYMLDVVTALSVAPAPGTNPKVWVTTRFRVKPGKQQEFDKYLQTDVMPSVKRAVADGKAVGFIFARGGLGAPSNEGSVSRLQNKYADLDPGNPLASVMSAEASARMGAPLTEFAEGVETTVSRVEENLNY